MPSAVSLLLIVATALHSVWGCCWRFGPAPGGDPQPPCRSYACGSHAGGPLTVARAAAQAPGDIPNPSRLAAEGGDPAHPHPLGDHECHEAKCVGLLPSKANAAAAAAIGSLIITAATIGGASAETARGVRERAIFLEPRLPLADRLRLQRFLI